MISRYEIIEHASPRPDAEQIIFCDGTDGRIYCPQTDLELSHWRPNHTPAEYRAGTSTEICFRFLDQPRSGRWTIAVNNHVDVDGMLSVYVLVHSGHALAHRQTIIQAAEMGDFWGWGEPAAQRVFQGLTLMMNSGLESRDIFAAAFDRVPGLIEDTNEQTTEIEASLLPLRQGTQWVEQKQIIRRPLNDRLTQYVVPIRIAGADDERASYVPEFNESISEKAILWPQVRHRWDAQRLCLVSTERSAGWFHDLWCPGYLWADTEGLWQVPGLNYHDGMCSYDFNNPALISAIGILQQEEHGPGRWCLGGTHAPFGKELQNQFPLVGRVLDVRGRPIASRLTPDEVAETLETLPL